jgi:hypothetical protein
MTEDRIERLPLKTTPRDPSASKRAAYIRRTIEKARRWVRAISICASSPVVVFPAALPLTLRVSKLVFATRDVREDH